MPHFVGPTPEPERRGTFGETLGRVGNVAAGSASGLLGLPSELTRMMINASNDPSNPVNAITNQARSLDDLRRLRQRGIPPPINPVRTIIPEMLSQLPLDTNWWGRALGADTESRQFQAGTWVSPDMLVPAGKAPLIAGILGGRVGANATRGTFLARAENLYANRATTDQIWRETGWVLDPVDQHWKFELPHWTAKVNVRELNNSPDGISRLQDVYHFPELYTSYPWLRNWTIRSIDELGGLAGYADHVKKEIGLGNLQVGNEIAAVLGHEISHAIQEIEGFSRGGFVRSVPRGLSSASYIEDSLTIAEKELGLVARQIALFEDAIKTLDANPRMPMGAFTSRYGLTEGDEFQQFAHRTWLEDVYSAHRTAETTNTINILGAQLSLTEQLIAQRTAMIAQAAQAMHGVDVVSEISGIASDMFKKNYRGLGGEVNARLSEYRMYRALEGYNMTSNPLLDRPAMLARDAFRYPGISIARENQITPVDVLETDIDESVNFLMQVQSRRNRLEQQIRDADESNSIAASSPNP